MSQSNSDASASVEQSDTADDSNVSVAPAVIAQLKSARLLLEKVSEDDMADMSDRELVDVRTELKELEDVAEDARKNIAEDELEDRVSPGERLHGLHHIESHNKYVAEDTGTVIGRLANAGIDYTEYVALNASALADAGIDVEIGQYDYTYFR